MAHIADAMNNGFNLFSGTSAETSGGLLIAVEKEKVCWFIYLVFEETLHVGISHVYS